MHYLISFQTVNMYIYYICLKNAPDLQTNQKMEASSSVTCICRSNYYYAIAVLFRARTYKQCYRKNKLSR
jgi:hypothetical protein